MEATQMLTYDEDLYLSNDDIDSSFSNLVSGFFIGPIAILNHLKPLIVIVLLTKLFHLLFDLIVGSNFRLFKHLLTYLLSSYQLYLYTDDILLFISINFILVIYTLQEVKVLPKGNTIKDLGTFVTIAIFSINEFNIYFYKRNHLTKLRTIYATLLMKHLSNAQIYENDNLIKVTHYFHPASCIFGPWHAINQELKIDLKKSTSASILQVAFKQFKSSVKTFSQACSILLISTNLHHLDDLFDNQIISQVLPIYIRALDFRLSHYFISYLAQSFLSLWQKEEPELCRIKNIEWPRSLVEVVVFWNINMHIWLKEYCFKPLKRQTSNVFYTILLTYLISSLLHGFKFHIWSVLLSLGIFTWIEHTFRYKLAKKLNACVRSRECKKSPTNQSCLNNHSRTPENSIIVHLINLFFRLQAIAQLAYLGYIFVGDTDAASYRSALASWSELHFFGHYLALLLFTINNAI